MASAGEESFFRSKYTTTIAFAAAVLLFLLPFVEVRCNGMTVAQNTGLGLAVGNDYALGESMKSLQNSINEDRDIQKDGPTKESGKVYVLALISLILGIVGIALSFTNNRIGIINTMIGVLAALSLIGLMFHLNHDIDQKSGRDNNDVADSARVSIAFTIWYFLSLVLFLAGAFFSFKRDRLLASKGAPSGAPQLDLDNPGEQSEFPKSASESDIG